MDDEERVERLIRQIEAVSRETDRVRGQQSAHEQVCAERYKGLDQRIGGMSDHLGARITSLDGAVTALANRVAADGAGMAAWKQAVVVGLISAMIALIGWEAKMLYDLQPLRSKAEATTR